MATQGDSNGRDTKTDAAAPPAAYANFRDRPVDDLWRARRRLADAVRGVLDQLVGVEMTESEIDDATLGFERYEHQLAARPHMHLQDAFDRVQRGGADEEVAEVVWRLDYGPSLGFCNPAAAPVRTWQTDRGTRGAVCFGARYEGPPGCVNGGYVAAALDEMLGLSAARSGMQAVTGKLTVSYRNPTPLEKELTLTGRLVRVEGRKITVEAHLRDGDELLAEAEGLFLALRAERG